MNKVFILLIMCLLLATPCYAVNWCVDANIVACYTIETGSGTTWVDQSSNSNDGTFKGAGEPLWSATVPTSVTDGFEGTSTWSVDYDDDSNDSITASDSASLDIDGEGFSFVVWIRPNFTQATDESFHIFDKTNNNASGYRMFFVNAVDDWRFRLFTSAGAVNVDTEGLSWSADTWYHVAVTYDGANMKIYWDGGLENSSGQTGNITTNDSVLYIGIQDDASDSFEGNMDEYAIFDTGLDLTDINDIMDNGLIGGLTYAPTIQFKGLTMKGVDIK